jgi:hypothetical protein
VDDDVVARMAALQAGDVRAVLLDLVARRAASLRPADVLRRYETEASFWPSAVDPAAYRRFETWALSILPDEFVELVLAPHAPLGTSSVLGTFSQDRVMTTTADSEVVSDSTNVLALECARRRRQPASRRGPAPTRLAASHRMLRPRDRAHFGLLALCTAGRDRGHFAMQLDALREHVDWHVRVITAHATRLSVRVLVTDLSDGGRRAALDAELLRPMRRTWPTLEWSFDQDRQAGRNYYDDVCFAIHAVEPGGACWNLSDGGFTDWTAKLLADRKERLLISGLGGERLLGLGAVAGPSIEGGTEGRS